MCLVYYAKLIAGSTNKPGRSRIVEKYFSIQCFMLSDKIANVIVVVVVAIAEVVVVRPIVVVHQIRHLALIVYTFLTKQKIFLWGAINLICIKQVVVRVKKIFLYRKRAVYLALICETLIFLKETELPPF